MSSMDFSCLVWSSRALEQIGKKGRGEKLDFSEIKHLWNVTLEAWQFWNVNSVNGFLSLSCSFSLFFNENRHCKRGWKQVETAGVYKHVWGCVVSKIENLCVILMNCHGVLKSEFSFSVWKTQNSQLSGEWKPNKTLASCFCFMSKKDMYWCLRMPGNLRVDNIDTKLFRHHHNRLHIAHKCTSLQVHMDNGLCEVIIVLGMVLSEHHTYFVLYWWCPYNNPAKTVILSVLQLWELRFLES